MVFPTPYPQGYGGTPPWPRPRAYRQAGSPEHARGGGRHATVAVLYSWFARASPGRESRGPPDPAPHTLRGPSGSSRSDRRTGRASDSVSHATGRSSCPDPVPPPRGTVRRRPPGAPRATWCAGRRPAARSRRWFRCGAAPPGRGRPVRRSVRRPSRAPAGCWCAAPGGSPRDGRPGSRAGAGGARPVPGPSGPGGGRRGHTGRLTGFRARDRTFSANFRPGYVPCRPHPPSPSRPARKGSHEPRAPYGDWPPRRGALPRTLHECDPS